jgi:hypothetical protein
LSKLLAAGAIALFAVGHALPINIVQDVPRTGWEVSREMLWYDLPRLAERAWTCRLDAYDWLKLAVVSFLPLFCLGIASFLLMARSRPRTAGLVAALSGLCAVGSLVTLSCFTGLVGLASGYCVG